MLAGRVLEPGGLLSNVLSTYEHRPEQLRVAVAASRLLGEGGILLAEAGTGTGKTLAYLTACADQGHAVVVSTGTRNLQDQIMGHDVPMLERALGRSIGAVCLKGLGNYVCLRRLRGAERVAGLLDPVEAEALERIRAWARTTQTGDRAELADLPEDLAIWRDVASDTETRLGPRCPFHEECFVTRARRAAQEARLIVTNHHLFFADLALRAGGSAVLPDYSAVIFDEAHQLDGVATEFFGLRVSGRRVERLARECGHAIFGGEGLDGASRQQAAGLVARTSVAATQLFDAIRTTCGDHSDSREDLRPEDLAGPVEQAYWRLDAELETLAARLSLLDAADEAMAAAARRVTALRDDLGEVLGLSRRAYVYWKEREGRGVAVGASPIDVSELIRERVLLAVESVVLTSATLATGGSFAYVRERLGIDLDAAELVVPSPFDFRRQAALFLPRDAPDPREQGFASKVASQLLRLVPVVEGGTLVLFTSHRVMREVHGLVAKELGRVVRMQGDRPKHVLLEELRAGSAPVVLLGTASFWEGVDVPGRGLELVVIDKLPFASPGDPVVAARLRGMLEQGRNPFEEYQVPQAALALKQGFGRLIRSHRDTGIVAVLDARVRTMRYGKTLLGVLPRTPIIETIEDLREWWKARPTYS